MHKKFGPNTLSQKFKEVRKAFKLFGEIELQGRQSIQQAIIVCYDIYLHYNEKLIRKRCKKAGISYKLKKPMKMILMLAMRVSDDCGDERIKARIRTYVRVLRRFNSLSYDLYTAEENLGQYGIDYFANLRSKKEDDTDNVNDNEDEDDDSDKQLELPFGDGDDDTEDDADDDIGEDDNNNADTVTSTSEAQKQSLGDKTVKFFQANNIKDKNYVIWVVGNEVYKSIDMALLKRLDDFDFIKLK